MKRKRKARPGYVLIEVPDETLTQEQRDILAEKEADEKFNAMSTILQLGSDGTFAGQCRVVEQLHDHFPGANEVPNEGAWILVTSPPHCEYTVPPLSSWFATPWSITGERHDSHRVRIVTPRGDLGLFPREYSLIKSPEKYHEFLGQGMELKFFGAVDGVPADKLFYLRSRGISKRDAVAMLLGEIRSHGVCWLEASREVCAVFGMKWPSEDRLATVQ